MHLRVEIKKKETIGLDLTNDNTLIMVLFQYCKIADNFPFNKRQRGSRSNGDTIWKTFFKTEKKRGYANCVLKVGQ